MNETMQPPHERKHRSLPVVKFWIIIGGVLILLLLCGVAALSYRNTITPSGIIIHHSAVLPFPDGTPIDVNVLNSIHEKRGFSIFYWGRTYHVGYHYIILPDGTVQQGRPEHCQGAHAIGYNSYIGICLIGDFSSRDNPHGERGLQQPTEAQIRSLTNLSRRLREKYQIPLQHIHRHNDVNLETECPGDRFAFNAFLNQLNAGQEYIEQK